MLYPFISVCIWIHHVTIDSSIVVKSSNAIFNFRVLLMIIYNDHFKRVLSPLTLNCSKTRLEMIMLIKVRYDNGKFYDLNLAQDSEWIKLKRRFDHRCPDQNISASRLVSQ